MVLYNSMRFLINAQKAKIKKYNVIRKKSCEDERLAGIGSSRSLVGSFTQAPILLLLTTGSHELRI